MEVGAISTELLKRTCRAWRQAQAIPDVWLSMDLLATPLAVSTAEKQIQLHDLVLQKVEEELAYQRRVESLDCVVLVQPTRAELTAVFQADMTPSNPELRAWSAIYHHYFAPVFMSVEELAQAANTVPRNFHRWEKVGFARLVDWLRRAEMDRHGRRRSEQLRKYLPPPDYVQLFGLETQLQQLGNLFADADGPRFVTLEGIGGIGKTAVARAWAHEAASQRSLAGIVWISARQEWLTDAGEIKMSADPARSFADVVARLTHQLGQEHLAGLATVDKLEQLRPLLQETPYLIIIDNLETLADIETVVPALQLLSGKTRFIFTSRYTMAQFPYVQRHIIPRLSLLDSHALLQSELTRRGRAHLLNESEMSLLYERIGGLPLALKLAVAQLGHLPLTAVLEGIQRADSPTPDKLYHYIYRRTWQLLDDSAKKLLLSFLYTSPDGVDAKIIRGMNNQSEAIFNDALAQLKLYSLIEVGGSLIEPTYRLHRLTTTFLQTNILLGWE